MGLSTLQARRRDSIRSTDRGRCHPATVFVFGNLRCPLQVQNLLLRVIPVFSQGSPKVVGFGWSPPAVTLLFASRKPFPYVGKDPSDLFVNLGPLFLQRPQKALIPWRSFRLDPTGNMKIMKGRCLVRALPETPARLDQLPNLLQPPLGKVTELQLPGVRGPRIFTRSELDITHFQETKPQTSLEIQSTELRRCG